MSLPLVDTSTIPVLEQVIRFTQARHTVLAGNIANMDTPGYRVQDLPVESFQTRLREALTAREKQASSLEQVPLRDPLDGVSDSLESILYHDLSNVGLEQQITEISKNQFMHNLAISVMNHQFQLLQTAVSERV